MKEWTMGAPLFTFSMKENLRDSTFYFLNGGEGKGVPLFTFSKKEWRTGAPLFTFSMNETAKGSANHFLNEINGRRHSSLPQ